MLLSKALIKSIFAVVEFFCLEDIFFQDKRSVTRYEIICILLARKLKLNKLFYLFYYVFLIVLD